VGLINGCGPPTRTFATRDFVAKVHVGLFDAFGNGVSFVATCGVRINVSSFPT
jgi:hypothetical protein